MLLSSSSRLKRCVLLKADQRKAKADSTLITRYHMSTANFEAHLTCFFVSVTLSSQTTREALAALEMQLASSSREVPSACGQAFIEARLFDLGRDCSLR